MRKLRELDIGTDAGKGTSSRTSEKLDTMTATTPQPFSVPVLFTETDHEPKNTWTDYGPTERRIIAKGWVKEEGRKAFSVDTIWDKDVRIPLRDGVELLGDVFRPVTSDDKPVPAIMPWSHYGKTGTGIQQPDMFPWRVGVPRSETSGLEKWEAPDPAEWVTRGYAVVNIDARGSFKSGGDLVAYGTQEGRDGNPGVIRGCPWPGTHGWGQRNGSSLLNNLLIWLAWHPERGWETTTENPSVAAASLTMLSGYGTWNDYWEDKKPKLRNIVVPMYATASFSTRLHTEGSLRGFMLSRSSEKWLRWCYTQEWHDIYSQRTTTTCSDSLTSTCSTRITAGNPRLGFDTHSWATTVPPSSTFQVITKFKYETLFLDATTGSLGPHKPSKEGLVEHQADSPSDNGCSFVHTFEEYTELCGISKAKVYMSTPDDDDMDVYVVLRKLDKNGKELWHQNIPMEDLPKGTTVDDIPNHNVWRYIRPNGRLRASHRAITYESLTDLGPDEYKELMGPAYVYHPHTATQPLRRDQVVELEISLWPGGMIFDAGGSMRLEFAGRVSILQDFDGVDKHLVNYNVGRHRLHTGGGYESQFLVNLWKSGKQGNIGEKA
ncbi:cocaine esterase [Pyrenophora seminiperda CCB06]|uniref:Cocaine esterase n=1 Tax=Pyrenophora seminiperda CCB06 TaxID=1302712 RepID=A0A3M7MD98_9PLEO|nr:cocaine esterase [Pyrenophora seminiperda CCB06]